MHASFLSHKLRVGLLALAVAALATIVSASASAASTPGTADLQLSLSAVTQARVGDSIAYVLQVRNAGPERATTVRVSLELASQASFLSAASSQGACSPSSSTASGSTASGATAGGANTATGATVNQPAPVQCLVGPLGPGEQARVTVTARVNAAGTFSGKATVSADQPDPNAQNNSAELTTTAAGTAAGGADLRLSLSAPANARVDHSIHYVARVVNRGPQTATSVKFTDQLAGAARIVRVGASRGTCVGAAANAAGTSTSVTCSVGHLRRGAEARFDVVVQATAAGSVANTASVSSDVADSDTGNNSTQATTNVVASAPAPSPQPVVSGPNLRVDLAGPRHAKGGALIRYVAQVRNRGNVDATSTTLSLDVARSVVKVFSIATSQGTCSASATATSAATVTAAGANGTTATGASLNTPTGKVLRVPTAAVAGCSLGTLAPGAQARVVFVIRAHSRGKIVVTASVSANGTDTRLANNHASLTTQLNRHPQAVGKHAHRNDGAGHAKKASGKKDKD